MGQMTIVTGPEPRRRWSDEGRLPDPDGGPCAGACGSGVARRFEVSRGLKYTWRRELMQEVPS